MSQFPNKAFLVAFLNAVSVLNMGL